MSDNQFSFHVGRSTIDTLDSIKSPRSRQFLRLGGAAGIHRYSQRLQLPSPDEEAAYTYSI